jgi:hypothetical protein
MSVSAELLATVVVVSDMFPANNHVGEFSDTSSGDMFDCRTR